MKKLFVGAFALTLMMVSACGDDDSSSTTQDAPSTSAAVSQTTTASTSATGGSTDTEATTSTSGSDGTSGGSQGTGPATGEPIVVGMICACTGVFAETYNTVPEVIQAWADSVNATGGINGHPVKVIIKDDGNDPSRALVAVKELVENDRVVAIVGDNTPTSGSWADYISEKGVPVIAFPSSVPSPTNPNWFPVGPGGIVLWGAVTPQVAAAGETTMGFPYCAEAPACAQVVDILEAFGTPQGLGVSAIAVSASATSFTAPCLKMKDDGVDALLLGLDQNTATRVLDECIRQGVEAKQYNVAPSYGPAWLTNDKLDGTLLTSFVANFQDSSIAGVKDMQDQLANYSDLDPTELTFNSAVTWAIGKLFEAAATSANLGPDSTPEDVKNALYGLKDETLDGLTVPLTFEEGKPTVVKCNFLIKLTGGELVSQNNGEPDCLSPELASIADKLAAG